MPTSERVNWLKRDGIAAEAVASRSTGDDAARLDGIAAISAADVIVAGPIGTVGYAGWGTGGDTKDLLLRAGRCSFVLALVGDDGAESVVHAMV